MITLETSPSAKSAMALQNEAQKLAESYEMITSLELFWVDSFEISTANITIKA